MDSSLNLNLFEWAEQFEREAENNYFPEQQPEEPETITIDDYTIDEDFEIVEGDGNYCEVPKLDVETPSTALVPFFHNNSRDCQSPVLDVAPLSIAVPLNQYDPNETEQKPHVGFRSPLAKKLEKIIKCILRTIGQDQLQVPTIVDSTPELATSCRDSSTTIENKIESVITEMGRDEMIAILSEEGRSQFSLLERISGWTVSQAPRTKGTVQYDSFFRHNLLGRNLRSDKEVIRFILYEEYPGKKQKERHIEDAPSTLEKRLRITTPPPVNLQENFRGSNLYDWAVMADERHELANNRLPILIQHTSNDILRYEGTLQGIVEEGKKIFAKNL